MSLIAPVTPEAGTYSPATVTLNLRIRVPVSSGPISQAYRKLKVKRTEKYADFAANVAAIFPCLDAEDSLLFSYKDSSTDLDCEFDKNGGFEDALDFWFVNCNGWDKKSGVPFPGCVEVTNNSRKANKRPAKTRPAPPLTSDDESSEVGASTVSGLNHKAQGTDETSSASSAKRQRTGSETADTRTSSYKNSLSKGETAELAAFYATATERDQLAFFRKRSSFLFGVDIIVNMVECHCPLCGAKIVANRINNFKPNLGQHLNSCLGKRNDTDEYSVEEEVLYNNALRLIRTRLENFWKEGGRPLSDEEKGLLSRASSDRAPLSPRRYQGYAPNEGTPSLSRRDSLALLMASNGASSSQS